ncbi:coiled-coil domain-containing protein 180 [Carcharodon carcharias]|uniref:coiled-coil domain-containing protein 180 n=1 Tax=Carcharodon carcharias TaxID=13397 RepID=UPI001B7F293D|nr:coiled-coil domain-containing protein 180 [Carcharodon carcharias]
MGEVRVVPSGKVYRQIFDAEVQLVRKLGEARRKSQHHGLPFDGGGIPIVRNLDTSTGQVISHRQRTWMEGLLNDGFTENPVLHRDAVLSAIKPKEVVELSNAVMEVKGLPDAVVPKKIGSSIIQQLTVSKQQRHETTVMKLEEELATISEELEMRFIEAAEHLMQEMEVSYQTVQELWLKTEHVSDRSMSTFENLQELWEAIVSQSLHRRKLIKELDRTYKEYEKERVKRITAVFKDCLEALDKIAYIPSSDIYRFIDKEAMLVNQALLANQRAMSKLYVNLMEADLMEELSERQKRNAKVQELNLLKKNDIIQKFKDFLAKDWSAGLAMENESLMKEQLKLNNQRIQRLDKIINMKPCDLNKASVDEWYDAIQTLNLELDSLHIQYTSELQAYYEKLYHDWMTEIDRAEEMLVNLEVCTKEEAKQLIVSDFLPIVGNLQRLFESEQYAVDKHMENLAQQMDLQSKEIYNVCKEATELWEVHQMNLADQEHQLKEQLDDCRKKHDKANQAKEANLDLLIDQLRQRNTEEELKSDLKKAFSLLDGIVKGYMRFYQKQLKIVHNYPSMSEKELHEFSTAISKCFDVIEIYKPNKLKIILDAPSKVASLIEATVAHSSVSNIISEDIPDASEESRSIREEATDQSTIIDEDNGEGAELSEQELGSHIPGLRIESIHKWEEVEGSRNTSILSALESSFISQHLSEEGSMENTEAFLSKSKSDSLEETASIGEFEYFKTSKGNTYTVICDNKSKDCNMKITPLADYMKHAFIPETAFLNLKKKLVGNASFYIIVLIRVNFFELLEDWYDKAMENARIISVIKKKEFKAELELRMHLHKPREKRIKMDVLHVRAVELRLHREKVERHCKGVDEALKKMKKDFKTLQSEHCKATLNFRNSIHSMEEIFKTGNKSDRLVTLLNSLNSRQGKYMDSVNKFLRNFQNMLDKSLAQLQDGNKQFITSFRLFANGGNYTPQEIAVYNQQVEQTATNIAKTEGTIMVDLEVMEALSLEQSTGVIKEVEDKFMRYTLDLMFIEKIKRFLTNTQTRIKTVVVLSNRQTLNISSHLEQFERKIDACAQSNLDKEVVLPEELYNFAKIIRDLMEKRATYLKCLVEPALTEVPLQGPIATATRVEFHTQERKVNENLLQPTRKGKIATEDVAIGVIKEILHTHKSEVLPEVEPETADEQSTVRGFDYIFHWNEWFLSVSMKCVTFASQLPRNFQIMSNDLMYRIGFNKKQINFITENFSDAACLNKILNRKPRSRMSSSSGSQVVRSPGMSSKGQKTGSTPSAVKYYKVNRLEAKYQVFDEPAEVPDHFKGIIKFILWENTNALLAVAEDFYKKKDRHPIYRSEYLKDTFEQCADDLTQKMLSYQAQADVYHSNCLQEFREQLKVFEELVSSVPPFLINNILKQHMDFITKALAEKRSTFRKKLQQLENAKTENKRRLRPILGHPNNLEMLLSLCKEEEERQDAEAAAINSNAENQKKCMLEHAKGFVAALSSISERLLLEFDNFLTVDNVHTAQPEAASETTRQKRTGAQLQEKESSSSIKILRESRIWPGIPADELSHMCLENIVKGTASTATLSMETAAVTTAKTVLADLATAESRDSAYKTYKEHFLQEISQIERETNGLLINAQRWQDGWRDSVVNIKKLYTLVRPPCIMPSPVLDT